MTMYPRITAEQYAATPPDDRPSRPAEAPAGQPQAPRRPMPAHWRPGCLRAPLGGALLCTPTTADEQLEGRHASAERLTDKLMKIAEQETYK